MRVFIYSCEETYHGLHGIENMRVAEVATIQEADEWGRQMSEDVIESYSSVIEAIEEVADEVSEDRDSEEWQEAYNEELSQHLEWYVYHINEDVAKDIPTEELDAIASRLGQESFIEEYCDGEVHE